MGKAVKYFSLKGWFALLAVCMVSNAAAQLRLTVSAPKSVDINTPYFQVRYTIATDAATDFVVGNFKDFEVLAGPSSSVSRSMTSINGHTTSNSSSTYTVTLAPRKKGRFTIPQAEVKVGNHIYRSTTAAVQVSGSGSRSAQPQQTRSSGQPETLRSAGSRVSDRDLYVTARLGRKEVNEQEAVPLTYDIFARSGVGLNSVGLRQKPDFKGMVSQEMPVKNIDPRIVHMAGQTYRTGTVQQYLLFPQQSGRITIPGLTFDCVVVQRDASIDPLDAFFNGGGNIGVTLKRTAAAVNLVVKPLPTPRPAGYSGGEGHFSKRGHILSPTVRTNDMVTYRVTISGSGNLKLLTPPAIAFPTDFDTYPPQTTDKTTVTNNGVSGDMVFDYTFVPRNIGVYEIPETDFVYFDPQTGDYRTVKLPAVKLDVKKGTRSDADLARERALRNSDIRPLHPEVSGWNGLAGNNWWNTWTYWAAFALLFGVAAGTKTMLAKQSERTADIVRTRRNKAGKIAARRLRKAKALLDKGENIAFYAELAHALQSYFSDKFNVRPAELTRERIRVELGHRNAGADLTERTDAILDKCEYARFAPGRSQEEVGQLYEDAVTLIGALERVAKSAATLPDNADNNKE